MDIFFPRANHDGQEIRLCRLICRTLQNVPQNCWSGFARVVQPVAFYGDISGSLSSSRSWLVSFASKTRLASTRMTNFTQLKGPVQISSKSRIPEKDFQMETAEPGPRRSKYSLW